MQSWQALTSLKIFLECTLPLTHPGRFPFLLRKNTYNKLLVSNSFKQSFENLWYYQNNNFNWPFGNLGIGISASALALALALQKFYFCHTKFFMKNRTFIANSIRDHFPKNTYWIRKELFCKTKNVHTEIFNIHHTFK